MSDNINNSPKGVEPWIVSLGISVFCCALFFAIMSGSIKQLNETLRNIDTRLATLENKPAPVTPLMAPAPTPIVNEPIVVPMPSPSTAPVPVPAPQGAAPGVETPSLPGTARQPDEVPSAPPEVVAPVMTPSNPPTNP